MRRRSGAVRLLTAVSAILLLALVVVSLLGHTADAAPASPATRIDSLAKRQKSFGDILSEVLESVGVTRPPSSDSDDGDGSSEDGDNDNDGDNDSDSSDADNADGSDADNTNDAPGAAAPSPTAEAPSPSPAPTQAPPKAEIKENPDGSVSGNYTSGDGSTRITVVVTPVPPKASRSLYITAIVLFIAIMIVIPVLVICTRLCEYRNKRSKRTRFEDEDKSILYGRSSPSTSKNGLGAQFKNIFSDAGRPSTDGRDPYSFRPLAADAGDLGRVGLMHAKDDDDEMDLESMDTLRPSADIAPTGSSSSSSTTKNGTSPSELNKPRSQPPEYSNVNVFAGFKDDDGETDGNGTLYRVSLDSLGGKSDDEAEKK